MPLKSAPAPIGISTGTTLGVSRSLIDSVGLVEVGVLLVHRRDDEQHRILPRDRLANIRSVPASTPVRRADHHQRAVGGRDPGDRVALEVQEARRVEQVDLRVLPLGVGAAERD